jgi:phosphatidylinositol alpha-mannosyltransferase
MATRSKRHLKIGYVLDDGLDKPDGVQQYILSVGEWMRHKGHDVHYLVGETKRDDLINVHSLSRNIGVRFNGGNRLTIPLPTNLRKLRKSLRAEQFDVLHVQVPYSPMMGARVIQSSSKKVAVVGTFHIAPYSGLVTLGTRALGIWTKSSLKRFDAMLSVSSTAAEFARRTFKLESKILPNTVDYSWFHKARAFPAYNDKKNTILFLGRLVPRKGCRELLAAVGELSQREKVPPFRVLICGRGPEEPQLKRFVTKLGLEDVVEFKGFVSEQDKPRYYASADIAVFPSSGGESFGIVLLEAMASGKAAVLAGDNPGYRSVLADKPELLFDPHDPHALADLLEKYLRDTKLRQQTKRWGAAYSKNFDVEVVGAKLLRIYRQALHKHRRQ